MFTQISNSAVAEATATRDGDVPAQLTTPGKAPFRCATRFVSSCRRRA
ncbi:hypothetical protein [Blastococcus sp. SYSU DS0973]